LIFSEPIYMAAFNPEIDAQVKNFFDKIIVITVPRFHERHEKIKKRLSGLSFDFFFGADKNELTDAEIRDNYLFAKENSLAVRKQFRPLNKGEIACALSHRSLYKTMIEKQWNRVLVFEDDIVPDPNHFPLLISSLNELPSDWELLYLGYLKNEKSTTARKLKQQWYRIQAMLGFSRIPAAMIGRTLPRAFSPSLYRAGFHDCTHAYALTLDAAKKLWEAQLPVTQRADNLLSGLILRGELKAFITAKPVFNQEVFLDKSSVSHIR
jgi:glycosyl transferase family 25